MNRVLQFYSFKLLSDKSVEPSGSTFLTGKITDARILKVSIEKIMMSDVTMPTFNSVLESSILIPTKTRIADRPYFK